MKTITELREIYIRSFGDIAVDDFILIVYGFRIRSFDSLIIHSGKNNNNRYDVFSEIAKFCLYELFKSENSGIPDERKLEILLIIGD